MRVQTLTLTGKPARGAVAHAEGRSGSRVWAKSWRGGTGKRRGWGRQRWSREVAGKRLGLEASEIIKRRDRGERKKFLSGAKSGLIARQDIKPDMRCMVSRPPLASQSLRKTIRRARRWLDWMGVRIPRKLTPAPCRITPLPLHLTLTPNATHATQASIKRGRQCPEESGSHWQQPPKAQDPAACTTAVLRCCCAVICRAFAACRCCGIALAWCCCHRACWQAAGDSFH
jgi:hypothetical protein